MLSLCSLSVCLKIITLIQYIRPRAIKSPRRTLRGDLFYLKWVASCGLYSAEHTVMNRKIGVQRAHRYSEGSHSPFTRSTSIYCHCFSIQDKIICLRNADKDQLLKKCCTSKHVGQIVSCESF